LFERQVQQRPDGLAVKMGRHSLSYDQLNRRANQIAHAIQQQRGPQSEPIFVLMDQGIELIAALLGVVKAGKMYVAQETQTPKARLTSILEDTQAPLILTETAHLELAQELASGGPELLAVDGLGAEWPDHNPTLGFTSDRYLNIMYTSGSTGGAKGVIQSHRNLTYDNRERPGMGVFPDDRVALVVPCSFGASAAVVFGTLMRGGALFPFDLKREGVSRLGPWLREERITIYQSVPTVFRHLLNGLEPGERFPDMRLVRLGGEPVLRRDFELFKRHFPQPCKLRLGLGTTETYLVTYMLLDANSIVEDDILPTGYPDAGKEVLILGEQRQPLPPGEVGEIAVRSRYLSPGYWRRPELTAAAFLPEPDGSDARLYFSGDLGRFRPDGCLEHLGRKDFQVKIRGHRVETAEVEQALLELEGVREAVVVAQEKGPGDNRLVAYLVPRAPGSVTPAEARQHLIDRLPTYMAPSLYMIVNTLPLLPFGKVNRRALPPPNWAAPTTQTPYVAPRTESEQAIADIWRTAMGVERVGIDDNFFELGGQSLIAAEIVAEIRRRFPTERPLSHFLEAPTVAAQARLLDRPADEDGATPLDQALRLLGQV
jgi:amino acid adenylation domain-containing protein